jgi:hypothetical protein
MGVTDGSNAGSGVVGEYVYTGVLSYTNIPGASGAVGALCSISLPAGDWEITGWVNISTNGATPLAYILGINTSVAMTDATSTYLANPLGTAVGGSIPNYRVNITGTTTYYLNFYATYSVATPQYVGRLGARRAR